MTQTPLARAQRAVDRFGPRIAATVRRAGKRGGALRLRALHESLDHVFTLGYALMAATTAELAAQENGPVVKVLADCLRTASARAQGASAAKGYVVAAVRDGAPDGLYGPFDTLAEARRCAEEFQAFEIVDPDGYVSEWEQPAETLPHTVTVETTDASYIAHCRCGEFFAAPIDRWPELEVLVAGHWRVAAGGEIVHANGGAPQ